jgi:galactoside O-acetyltransferase
MSSFYTTVELQDFGFKNFGHNLLISKKASIYGANLMSFGNNVRIDDFCILSGEISLGSNIHIGAYCALYGSNGIVMEDYSGLSPRCTLFSATDDFSGDYLISPMAPKEFCNVTGGQIMIKMYSQVGAGATIMPNVTIETGVAVGAMSFVNKNLQEWTIYGGIPVRKIKERKRGLLKFIEDEK